MTVRLEELRTEAAFPLFALHPRHWSGDVFVGNVARERTPAWLHTVQIVYLDGVDGATGGATISNVDGALITRDEVEPFEIHLLPFIARFDTSFVRGFMRSGSTPLDHDAFVREDGLLLVAGQDRGANVLKHKHLPLEAVRCAIRGERGVTDLVVAAWNHNARDLAAILEPVTDAFAKQFDAGSEVYPPPEWGLS